MELLSVEPLPNRHRPAYVFTFQDGSRQCEVWTPAMVALHYPSLREWAKNATGTDYTAEGIDPDDSHPAWSQRVRDMVDEWNQKREQAAEQN